MDDWYQSLSEAKNYLVNKDPILDQLFKDVDRTGFMLHTIIKDPYTSLICAIIGQKISYHTAKSLRAQLYSICGNTFTPQQICNTDLSFLGSNTSKIILDVTNYIITNNINLNNENEVRSLIVVKGIGPWTIETTLLTCLTNWDLFPLNDKFLQTRMKRLYGNSCDIKAISNLWSPYKSIVTWYLWRWF